VPEGAPEAEQLCGSAPEVAGVVPHRAGRGVRNYRAFTPESGVHTIVVGEDGGSFAMTSADDRGILRIIASDGMGWEHVSVSRSDRTPSWAEMEQVKRAFFKDDETAMQLHVPPTDHISVHPYCLHLWRPHGKVIPRPPAIMVA
jgi:hypothetical protein